MKTYKIQEVLPGAVVTDQAGSMFLVTELSPSNRSREPQTVATVKLSGGPGSNRIRHFPLDYPVHVHRPHLTGL